MVHQEGYNGVLEVMRLLTTPLTLPVQNHIFLWPFEIKANVCDLN